MKKNIVIIALVLCAAMAMTACAGGSGTAAKTEESQSSAAVSAAESADAKPAEESVAATDEAVKGSGDIIEPEMLVSKDEAAKLLGEAVVDGEKKEEAVVGHKIIFYNAESGDLCYLQVAITQEAFMENPTQTPTSIYNATKEAISKPEDQVTVEGIGDEYFFGTPGLHILTDGYYINIAASGEDDAKTQEILVQAGALAVKNLNALIGK